MDISAEKNDIIRKFQMVYDIDLINAIKSLLDFGLHKQTDDDAALNASIDRAMDDSENGRVRPYEEFIAEVRKRKRA
jgi:glyoxylate carboligase